MHSNGAKVLTPLLHEPMLVHVLRSVTAFVDSSAVSVLTGFKSEDVETCARAYGVERCILQHEQLGTGHALQVAWEVLQHEHITTLFVINGDVPLLTTRHLSFLYETFTRYKASIAFLSFSLENNRTHGIVQHDATGNVRAIVEAKDYTDARIPQQTEVNAGVYCFAMDAIAPLLPSLTYSAVTGECYITELVSLALAHGHTIRSAHCSAQEDAVALLGVNTPQECIQAEEVLRKQVAEELLQKGVYVHTPEALYASRSAVIAPGVHIYCPAVITGETNIEQGVIINAYCTIQDSTIRSNARIYAHSTIESATVDSDARIGPYARLRPKAHIGANAKIGNFVEIKNATIEKYSSVGHLSYIGDATVGASSNIGAGTITCNYDGINKHSTTIGRNVFVGSLCALVAPVTVEDNALIGAGSVITHDVPSNTLALARAKQISLSKK